MANKDDYLTSYREFFEYFAQTVNPNDQLPVKLASYKFLNVEVVGGIIDWTTQYLNQKKCPPHLFSPLIKIIIEETRKSCKKQPISCGFNSAENAYEPLKLMQAVMAKTNEVCLRYLDNSLLCSLPAPSNTYYETTIYAIRNKRRKMEDRHVAIHDLSTMFNIQEASPSSYYAIFDGHAGHDAAAYSAAHLHQFLAENKYFITNPEQALLDAFCKTDALFLEKCKVENLSGGTTAVVALLRPKEKTLYIAWVGDSQALLVKQGQILQCVDPHKPCREDERERIEKSGGCVMLWGIWRVNGQLAVSRAIGDADYKPYVTAIPDVREFSLDGGEDFLIVACDGLWDYMTEDAAAKEVYYLVAENPDDTERISKHLVQLARYEGSADNISVIVVFLKEPDKIAAEARHWATRHGPPLTTDNMEAGLDNANNPFTNSNGSLKNLDVETDNIHLQKGGEGLLLNLTDNFKANGTDLSQGIFEKSNGTKKSSTDIHFDDGFGPETDVDAVDDAFSPVEKNKTFAECLSKAFNDEGLPKSFNDEVRAFSEGLANNNPLGNDFNPFLSKEVEDSSKEDSKDDFEEHGGDNREDTPTPPVDTVHDVGGLEENPAESDSEDEWNYFKGDQAKPETLSLQPETVVETSELEDAMSQLNPNAAEFVPVSPTRSIPSPACRALLNDEVLAQSPKRPVQVDIKVPNEKEFEKEVKSRPSDFDPYSNGHGHDSDSENNISGTEQIDNILNGKSIDEIPEFQPGSTPAKQPEEFHFGPNAAPFTPRPLDQSEAFSTKANYGDETEHTLNTSFNDSDLAIPHKDGGDPMSMSFSEERGESNPFQDGEDLNKVHDLPDNLDEFLEKIDDDENKENRFLEDTISDLPEHDVLAHLDNDRAVIQTTDLDKLSQEDEKELASPLEPEHDLLEVGTNIASATPDLVEIAISEKLTTDDSNISSLPDLEPIPAAQLAGLGLSPIPEPQQEIDDSRLSPIPGQLDQQTQEDQSLSPVPDQSCDLPESTSPLSVETDSIQSKSPLPDETELNQSKTSLPADTELPEEIELFQGKSPIPEETELIQSKTSLQEEAEINEATSPIPEDSELILSKSPLPENTELTPSAVPDIRELILPKSPLPEEIECVRSISPLPAEVDLNQSKPLLSEEEGFIQSKSPLPEETELIQAKSPVPVESDLIQSKSPVPIEHEQELVQQLGELTSSPLPTQADLQEDHPLSSTPDFSHNLSISPVPERAETLQSKSPVPVEQTEENIEQELGALRLSPLPGQLDLRQQEVQSVSPTPEVSDLLQSKSPVPIQLEKQVTNLLDVYDKQAEESYGLGGLESQSTVVEFTSGMKSPFDDFVESKSPVCQLKPTSDMFETEFNPTSEVERVELEAKSPGLPEAALACEYRSSADAVPESYSPFDPLQEQKQQDEEITSSVKDDISSPIELLSPVKSPEPFADGSVTADHAKQSVLEPQIIEDSFVQEDVHKTEVSPQGFSADLACPMPSLRQQFVNEPLVQANEINVFEASAPLEPSRFTELSNGFNNFVSNFTEEFSIKTDSIKPEFAEPAVITPSEDSKVIDELPAAFLTEELVQEPSPIAYVKPAEPRETSQVVPIELPVLAPLPIVAVASQERKEVKKDEKRSSAAVPSKKPIGKIAPNKPSTGPIKATMAPKSPATRASPKPAAGALKTAGAPRIPPKTGPAKPATSAIKTTTSATAASKPLPKPKPAAPAAPKPIERKPLANGDLKPAPRTTTKRLAAEAPSTKTTTRPATTTAAKTSPTKTATSRPATAPRTAPPKPSTTAPKAPMSATMAAKPRVPLASRTTAHTNGGATSKLVASATRTTTTAANRTSASPKPLTAPAKPKTISYTAPKLRPPITKTITKSPDVEKEKKESANKLTASRTTTVTKSSSATATSRTATTTVKKTETKPLSHRPASKTSTTTTRTTTVSKKPGEVKSVTKTKTTKVEKPKENGVAPTNITEEIKEITILNNIVNETENLLKDNSPLDNKLITETNALIDVNPAD